MNVLSLFDGMSCGQIALREGGHHVDRYYASEIKKHAIEQTNINFPNTIDVGSVEFVTGSMFNNIPINLLIGGSPCQDLTLINRKGGVSGKKSSLFWEYVRILRELRIKNPNIVFLLENVASMKNEDKKIISEALGVEPVFINSNLVSAQDRRRLYWTNIKHIELPVDKNIQLSDIINYNDKAEESMSQKKKDFIEKKRGGSMYVRVDGKKSMPITARGYAAWNTQFATMKDGSVRDLTLNEYMKLQTIPNWYKFKCIKSKATDLIGDGWTVDVIVHILKALRKNN